MRPNVDSDDQVPRSSLQATGKPAAKALEVESERKECALNLVISMPAMAKTSFKCLLSVWV
jgi:hypothetical protein